MFLRQQIIDFDKGDVIIKKSGIYLVIAGPQIAKLRGAKIIDFWLRVNNVDLPNSNVRPLKKKMSYQLLYVH